MDTGLTVVEAVLTGIHIKTDANGAITELVIDISLSYADEDGNRILGRGVSRDVWPVLGDTQRLNMQDIQDTIQQFITATYFA